LPRTLGRPARLAWEASWRLALIALGAVAVHKQLRDGNDFPIYWQAARDLLAGRSPYDVSSGLHGYVYLPWFALLLSPLAPLPLPVAAWTWTIANLVFLALACGALRDAVRDALPATPTSILWLAALPIVGAIHDNLMLGQANLLLLWLVAVGVRGILRAGAGVRHGLALALAAALKMPAAVLAAPMALRARTRPLLGFVAGALLALTLPFVVTGGERGARLLQEWREKVVAPAAAGTLQGSKVIDQSPQAALRRLLVDEPAFDGHAANVASLEPRAFSRVSRAASVTLLVAYVLVWLFAPARATPRALLVDLALGCCAMVQLTGFSLKAQFVVLLLPAWVAASLAFERPAPAARAALLAAGALFLLSQPGLVGRAASNWMLAYSSMTLGTLLLAATLAMFRWQLTPLPSAVPAAGPAPGTAP